MCITTWYVTNYPKAKGLQTSAIYPPPGLRQDSVQSSPGGLRPRYLGRLPSHWQQGCGLRKACAGGTPCPAPARPRRSGRGPVPCCATWASPWGWVQHGHCLPAQWRGRGRGSPAEGGSHSLFNTTSSTIFPHPHYNESLIPATPGEGCLEAGAPGVHPSGRLAQTAPHLSWLVTGRELSTIFQIQQPRNETGVFQAEDTAWVPPISPRIYHWRVWVSRCPVTGIFNAVISVFIHIRGELRYKGCTGLNRLYFNRNRGISILSALLN